MADLLQLDFVVKEIGLDKALTQTAKFEREILKTVKAYERGQITQDRYRKSLLNTKRQMAALTNENGKQIMSIHKANQATQQFIATQRGLSGAVGASGVAAQQTARKTNQLGVLMQQSGYQIGDFAVQVQSGTNVMVALGQQATQLVGTFAMLARSTALIALFSGLGVVLPVITAIAAAFMRTAKAADEAKDKVTGLSKTLKDFRQEQRALAQSVTTDQLALIDRIEAIKELQQEYLEVLRDTGGGDRSGKNRAEAESTILVLNDLLLKTTGQQKDLQVLINNEYVKRLKSMERSNILASIENKFGQDHIKYRNEARRQAEIELETEIRAAGISEALAERLRDRLKTQYDIIDAKVEQDKLDVAAKGRQEAIINSLKSGLTIYEKMVDENKAIQEAAQKIKDTHADEVRDLKEKIALVRIEAEHGKDSAALQEETAEFARDAYQQSRLSAGIKGNLLKAEMKIYDVLQREKKELADIVEKERQRLLFAKERRKFFARESERQMILNESPIFMNMDSIGEAAKMYQDRLKEVDRAQDEAKKSAEKLREELEDPLVSAIGSVSDAFGDFIGRGLKDFKGFVKDILRSFSNMIAQMIATAVNNRIMIGLGMGGAGTVAGTSAAFAGGAGAFLGTTGAAGVAGTGLMGGFGSVFGAGGIGMGGSFSALGSMLGGGGLGGGFTLGAAIPAIAAVAVVVGLLTKKTKLLDVGLRGTVEGFDAAIETFKVTQSSRLFGILKGPKVTAYEAASAEISDPIIEAINTIQTSVVDAAKVLGIGAGLFENFTYQFELSLKGLTDDEKMQAINQELAKMGDEFASLSGHFSDVNSLLAAANERYNLQIRLLETIGDQEQALSMRRESELASVDKLNRGLLEAIHAVEDAQRAVNIAFSNLASVIEREKRTLQQGYADSVESLKSNFDSLIEGIEVKLESAQRVASLSQGVYSALESALRGRGFTSQNQFSMARETATSYLRELRGTGRIEDEQALEDALRIVAEPSQDLYEDFVNYQRDFQKQTNVIRDLETKAKLQLTTDEKALLLLQEEKDAAQIRHEESLTKLDDNLQSELLALDKQYNELAGIKEINLTMVEAIKAVENAINTLELKQAAASVKSGLGGAAAGAASANTGGVGLLEQYDVGSDYTKNGQTYDHINLSGASQLLDAASQLGIQTSGQTGAEIQQAISNVGNLAVSLDNSTRAAQFALGGYHSGGVRMVGERGPELEMTGASRIMSNNDTRKMLQNPDLVEAVKSMKQEISELRNEQRQLGINNNKYTKRTYDLYRQWDTEGLPAERT